MGNSKTIEELLAEANARLKAGRMRVTIQAKRNTLYLMAVLPPKPSSAHTKPLRQWVSLGGIYLNVPGIKRAEAEAQRLRHELTMGKFNWADWVSVKSADAKGIEGWIKKFEADYFNRRSRTPPTETTWDKDYSIPYRRLVVVAAGRELSADVFLEAIATYEPDTRSRQRAVTAYGRLAEFAGVEVNFKGLRGRYSPAAVDPRDLPTDDQIVALIEGMTDPHWRLLVALMATYGLRDHEVYHLDMKAIIKEPGICVVQEGKTGWHEVWPYPKEWWENWVRPWVSEGVRLPRLYAHDGRNDSFGRKISQYFKRKGFPCLPYDLRHAWAARTAVYGLDPAIAAKMMGHDLTIHSRVYHRFINRSSMQQAFDRSQIP
jgi:integrase